MKNILISVSISYLNHGINKQNGKKVIAVKVATCAFAKRNPEKVQAYQTLRTLTYKTLVQGSNPGKPEFFQACVIKYIETNVDEKKFESFNNWGCNKNGATLNQGAEHYPG